VALKFHGSAFKVVLEPLYNFKLLVSTLNIEIGTYFEFYFFDYKLWNRRLMLVKANRNFTILQDIPKGHYLYVCSFKIMNFCGSFELQTENLNFYKALIRMKCDLRVKSKSCVFCAGTIIYRYNANLNVVQKAIC
jgi:hypothetical protein